MDVHVKRVEMSIPVSGQVSILAVTDKQYGDIHNFIGQKVSSLVRGPVQLELF